MTGPTHSLIGLALVTFLGHTTGIVPNRFYLGLVMLGSLLPDIDGNGMVRRLIPGLNVVSTMIEQTFGHQGIFHWLFLPFCIMAIAPWAGAGWFWLGFGYLSHLFADALTPGGIPAKPIRSRLTAKLLKTGSPAEVVLFLILLIGTVRSGFLLLDPEVQQILMGATSKP